jgi:hypothetical protein
MAANCGAPAQICFSRMRNGRHARLHHCTVLLWRAIQYINRTANLGSSPPSTTLTLWVLLAAL